MPTVIPTIARLTSMDDAKSTLGDGETLPSNFEFMTDPSNTESQEWKKLMVEVHNDIYGQDFQLKDLQVKPYPLSIRKSDYHGLGLFGPAGGIPKGVILCQYLGEKVDIESVADICYTAGDDTTGIIYSKLKGNITRFINSCGEDKNKRNVDFYQSFGKIYAVTSKKVAPGGELLMDYDHSPSEGSCFCLFICRIHLDISSFFDVFQYRRCIGSRARRKSDRL